jgi:hypothetical protein
MFGTKLGASADTAMDYICVLKQLKDFVNFLNVQNQVE